MVQTIEKQNKDAAILSTIVKPNTIGKQNRPLPIEFQMRSVFQPPLFIDFPVESKNKMGVAYLSVWHALANDEEGITFSKKIFFVEFSGLEVDEGFLLGGGQLLTRHEDFSAVCLWRIL